MGKNILCLLFLLSLMLLQVSSSYGEYYWIKSYGSNFHDLLGSTIETADGGFIAVGQSVNFGTTSGFKPWII
jgi:hypothetical protein